jgi:hypothetical protein
MPSLSLPRPAPAGPVLSGPARRRAVAAARGARTLAALALAGLVSVSCGPKDTEFPPACPHLALLADAGDLARFDGHGLDVTDLVTRARITAVPAQCEPGDPGTVRATLHVEAEITRGPASPAAPPPIAYFIALMEGDKVLREQDFALAPAFASNVDHAVVHGDDIELLLPVSKTKSAAAYRIFVGFRLTPEELAFNRAHSTP